MLHQYVSISLMEGMTLTELVESGRTVGSWKTKRGKVEIYDIGGSTGNGLARAFAVDHTKMAYLSVDQRPTVARYLPWNTVLYAWDGESAHRA